MLHQSAVGQKQDQELDSMFSARLSLTCKHFDSEEVLMHQTDYLDCVSHKKEHVILQAELAQFIQEIKRDQTAIVIGTLCAPNTGLSPTLRGNGKAFANYYHAIK